MTISSAKGRIPLYIRVVLQILREMAREPNIKPGIDYHDFRGGYWRKTSLQRSLGLLAVDSICFENFIAAPISNTQRAASEMTGLPLPENSYLLTLAVYPWTLTQLVRCLTYFWGYFSNRR